MIIKGQRTLNAQPSGGPDEWKTYARAKFNREHPINSLFVQLPGMQDPNVVFNDEVIVSTWVIDTAHDGRVAWVDSTKTIGAAVSAGLPNITGDLFATAGASRYGLYADDTTFSQNGAFYTEKTGEFLQSVEFGYELTSSPTKFSAQKSNAIYGNSNTVQPPAFVVHVWKRTA